MSKQVTAQPQSYPAELRDLLDRGQAGDAPALPELKRAFDEHPVLAAMLGDMPTLALEALLEAVAGKSLTAKEAIRREAVRLCKDLAGPDAPMPVRLLAERSALAWVEVHHADSELATALKKRSAESAQMRAAERRAQAAQVRYVTAIEAFTRVKQLTQPTSSSWINWPTVIDGASCQDHRSACSRSEGAATGA